VLLNLEAARIIRKKQLNTGKLGRPPELWELADGE
jgi:hypothetical protein